MRTGRRTSSTTSRRAARSSGYPERGRPLRAELQQEAVRGGGHRRAAGTWDELMADAKKLTDRRRHAAGLRAHHQLGRRRRAPVPLARRVQRRHAAEAARRRSSTSAEGARRPPALREAGQATARPMPSMSTAECQHHRAVPRQLRQRQDGDDHHGQLVAGRAEAGHGRPIQRRRAPRRSRSGRAATKSSSVSYSWLTIVNGKAAGDKQAAAWKFLAVAERPH